MGHTSMPLVGRDAYLAEFAELLSAVAAGHGGCVVIEGAPGIGKSRLLTELRGLIDRRSVTMAHACATELDRIAPLSVLVRALRTGSPPVLDDAAIAELGDQRGSRFWLIERLRDWIEEYAGQHRLVLLVDDAHWMDELSTLALRTLVPGLASLPVLFVLARRASGGEEPAQRGIDQLVATGGARRMSLEPLTEADVETFCQLALGAPADARVLRLATRGGGNPFLLEHLLATLRDEGRVVVDDAARITDDSLPATFSEAVDRRLRDLAPVTRRLLDVAAVLGRPFALHEAAGVAGVPAGQLLDAVEEATRAQVLVNVGDELTFQHDLVREAVYEQVGAPVRHALHREASTVLRAERRPASEIAEHILRSARKGDERAIGVLLEAAEANGHRAPDTAADLLLRALDLLDDTDPRWPAVVADTVGLLAATGRISQARELGDAALAAGLDSDSRAAIQIGLAEALKHAGEDAAAVELTAKALAGPDLPDRARARLLAVRAHALLYADDVDLDAADEAGAAAAELGARCGELGASVFGEVARTVVALSRGHIRDAIQYGQAATELANQTSGDAQRRHPSLWLARALGAADRFAEADPLFEAGERLARHLGTAWSLPLLHFYRAELRLAAGRLDDAEVEAEAGLLVTERLSARALAVALLGIRAMVAVRRDQLDAAAEYVSRASDLVDAGVGATVEDLNWALAVVRREQHGARAAVDVLEPVYAALPVRKLLLTQDPGAAPELVRLARATGADDHARRAAAAIRTLATDNPRVASFAAAAAHAEGLLHDDLSALREAVRAYRTSPRNLAKAAAIEDTARAERAGGDKGAAVALLDEALAIYSGAGAHRDHARVVRTLRGLGARRSPSAAAAGARTGWDSLTEAELRVVRLVAQGMTNRAVASTLFLSRHTVDTHIRHVFAKLGVSTRVELTRQALVHEPS